MVKLLKGDALNGQKRSERRASVDFQDGCDRKLSPNKEHGIVESMSLFELIWLTIMSSSNEKAKRSCLTRELTNIGLKIKQFQKSAGRFRGVAGGGKGKPSNRKIVVENDVVPEG